MSNIYSPGDGGVASPCVESQPWCRHCWAKSSSCTGFKKHPWYSRVELIQRLQGEKCLHCKPGGGAQAWGGEDAAGGRRGSWQGRGEPQLFLILYWIKYSSANKPIFIVHAFPKYTIIRLNWNLWEPKVKPDQLFESISQVWLHVCDIMKPFMNVIFEKCTMHISVSDEFILCRRWWMRWTEMQSLVGVLSFTSFRRTRWILHTIDSIDLIDPCLGFWTQLSTSQVTTRTLKTRMD